MKFPSCRCRALQLPPKGHTSVGPLPGNGNVCRILWEAMEFNSEMNNHRCFNDDPLVMADIAIENGPFIVGLPVKHGDFP